MKRHGMAYSVLALAAVCLGLGASSAASGSDIEAQGISRQNRIDRLQQKEANASASRAGAYSSSYAVGSVSANAGGGYGFGSNYQFRSGATIQAFSPPVQQPAPGQEQMPKVPDNGYGGKGPTVPSVPPAGSAGAADTETGLTGTTICPNCGGTIDLATGKHISGPTHQPAFGYNVAMGVNPQTGQVYPLPPASGAPQYSAAMVPQYSAPVQQYSAAPQGGATYYRSYSYSGPTRHRR